MASGEEGEAAPEWGALLTAFTVLISLPARRMVAGALDDEDAAGRRDGPVARCRRLVAGRTGEPSTVHTDAAHTDSVSVRA